MTTGLTPTELARLEASLPSTINTSMLDGYLAAVASGPNFVMPDQVLRWVSETAAGDISPDFKVVMPDQTSNNVIIQHYQAVNDALNDQVFLPNLTDPQAWCRGHQRSLASLLTICFDQRSEKRSF